MKGERRMYEELIAKMNPRPKFNLQWYKNEDLYSDGEVEDFIIKIIARYFFCLVAFLNQLH